MVEYEGKQYPHHVGLYLQDAEFDLYEVLKQDDFKLEDILVIYLASRVKQLPDETVESTP